MIGEEARASRAWARMRALEPRAEVGTLFPPIEEEFADHSHLFRGRVLNAGAGNRDISHLVDGELVNQDISGGLHNENIHILSPLHDIPVPDGDFDAIICNAVLEHVENPEEVLAEFARVCRPGGVLYLTVPFLQPEHLDPTDFQRYTIDGLSVLCQRHGFSVTERAPVHSVYTTLGWIALEWLRPMRSWRGQLLRWAILPPLWKAARRSSRVVPTVASAYRVVATRNAEDSS